MSNTRFAPHRYIYRRNGEKATGATTILGELAKPVLYRWNNIMGLKGVDTSKYVDEKAKAGSLAHEMILSDLRDIPPDLKQYTQYQIDQAENSFLKFLEWKKGHTLVPILVEEAFIYDPAPEIAEEQWLFGMEVGPYCGIVDCYCSLDGIPTLLDFKTSKAVYDEHFFQLAAYKFLLMGGCLVDKKAEPVDHRLVNATRILQIGRDESEGFGDHGRTDLTREFEIFKAALKVHLLKKKLKGD